MKLSNLTFVSLFVAACGGGGGEGEATSEVTGAATYRDAETDKQGNAQEPATPASQGMRVFLQANVALSLGAGLAIGAADADGVALIGDPTGSAGFHYYFF